MPLSGNLVAVVRTTITACVWTATAGVTLTALVLAHLVGRVEELESRLLALLGQPGV